MHNEFAFISNTIGEYELFIESKNFYWPRGLMKKTNYQRSNNFTGVVKEDIGDSIYIITGASIQSKVKDKILKNKITSFPMLTHKGVVESVFNNLVSYNFSIGKETYSIPLLSIQDLLDLNTYLGQPLGQSDKDELKNVLTIKEILDMMESDNKLEYVRAYSLNRKKDTKLYVEYNGKYFTIDPLLQEYDALPADLEKQKNNNRAKYYTFPKKENIEELRDELKKTTFPNVDEYLSRLYTWLQGEFVKVKIEKELFSNLNKAKLIQGVSTRLLTNGDDDNLILEINKKLGKTNNVKTESKPTQKHAKTKKPKHSGDKNIILYGPPGTGKTYHLPIYAVSIIENVGLEKLKERDFKEIKEKYDQYRDEGLIKFTTFHQSYGYEEFIEGIKPNIPEEPNTENKIQYTKENGIFKAFCIKAERSLVLNPSLNFKMNSDPAIWIISLYDKGSTSIKDHCFNDNCIRIGWDNNTPKHFNDDEDFDNNLSEKAKQVLRDFYFGMKIGDIVVSFYDEFNIDGVGIVTGAYDYKDTLAEYKRVRQVKWLISNKIVRIYEPNHNKRLTQGTLYRPNRMKVKTLLESIKPYLDNHDTLIENNKNHVFIIDEINRGNISKIFGELITLIEDNKRLGETEETIVTLPYTKENFGVPSNVYLLGTMNTADRSIALIDTALRRRFKFIEMAPKVEVLRKINNGNELIVKGININKMLKVMNSRIEVLYDREHAIGHSYFIELIENKSMECLSKIFLNKIFPLLQEYFYDDYSKIRLVLSDSSEIDDNNFINAEKVSRKLFNTKNEIDLEDRELYILNKVAFMRPEAYKKIYKGF